MPDAPWFLLAWVAGGVLAFMGAMAYAELAALRPRAGGEYVYLREAFGPLAGFPDRLDVVRRRLQRRDGGERGLPHRSTSIASFPALPTTRAFFAIPLPLTPTADVLDADAGRDRRDHRRWRSIHIRGVGPGRIVSNILTTLKVVGAA